MKVILLENIKGLGEKLDIKDVSGGHARNFLFPKKLAELATAANLGRRDQQLQKQKKELAELQALAEKLSGEIVQFTLKTGPAGEVFGSVTKKDIEDALRDRGYGEVRAALDQPLKTLGERRLGITFRRGVKGDVTIKIV